MLVTRRAIIKNGLTAGLGLLVAPALSKPQDSKSDIPVTTRSERSDPKLTHKPHEQLAKYLLADLDIFENPEAAPDEREKAIEDFSVKWYGTYSPSVERACTVSETKTAREFRREIAHSPEIGDAQTRTVAVKIIGEVIRSLPPERIEDKALVSNLSRYLLLQAFTIEDLFHKPSLDQVKIIFKEKGEYPYKHVPTPLIINTFKAVMLCGAQLLDGSSKDLANPQKKEEILSSMKKYLLDRIEERPQQFGIVDHIPQGLDPYLQNRLENLYLQLTGY